MEIPIFPLNMVVFPGMPFQLHIFEERYKKMVHDCTEADSIFGVVMIETGVEANGPLPVPKTIGCGARITNLEPLSEGRFNLWAIGQQRFEILALKHDRPYLVANVREFPLHMSELLAANNGVDYLRPWVERYLRALGSTDDMERVIRDMPTDPVIFAYLGAVVLQIPPVQKQPFLEMQDCLALIHRLQVVFRREVALVESLSTNQPPAEQGSFSLN